MGKEPTLEQLEKLLVTYREMGGSDAEISLLSREIVYDYLPEQAKSPKEIFERDLHHSIDKIHHFKKEPKTPFRHALSDLWHKKLFRYPFLFVVVFSAIFLILNLPLVSAKLFPPDLKQYETVREVVRPAEGQSAPLEAGETIPPADTLVVAKLGVRAPIIYANSIDEREIQNKLKQGVVHYVNTAMPGEAGNSFITGHSSNYWWEKGNYNYIFANLDRLTVGDQAKIYSNGKKYLYQVTAKKVVDPTDVSVLAQTENPTLTLMTCTPPGTNWKRLIVSFNQVSPQYVAPRIVEKQQEITSTTLPSTDVRNILDWFVGIFDF